MEYIFKNLSKFTSENLLEIYPRNSQKIFGFNQTFFSEIPLENYSGSLFAKSSKISVKISTGFFDVFF